MASYRTEQQAVVHPIRSAKAFIPYCNVSYRSNQELCAQLVRYMRQFCGKQKVAVDISTRAILIDGEHRYSYALIDPAPAKKTAHKEMH